MRASCLLAGVAFVCCVHVVIGAQRVPVEDWSVDRVSLWLSDGGFEQYTGVVRAASIDGQALVEKFDSLRAWRDVGVPVVGHIVRLLDARDALLASATATSASAAHRVTTTSHHDMWTVRGRLGDAPVSLPEPSAEQAQFYGSLLPRVQARRGVPWPTAHVTYPPPALEDFMAQHDARNNGLGLVLRLINAGVWQHHDEPSRYFSQSDPLVWERHGLSPTSRGNFFATSVAKLDHDEGQLRRLAAHGAVPQSWLRVMTDIGEMLRLGRKQPDMEDYTVFTLSNEAYERLGYTHNRLLYLPPDPKLSELEQDLAHPISPAFDVAELEGAIQRGGALPVSRPGFLRKKALGHLYTFCSLATVYWDIQGAHLQADMRDGFGNRMLFRLAEDLRERLPALLSHRTLVDIRSYKPIGPAAEANPAFFVHPSLQSDDITVSLWVDSPASQSRGVSVTAVPAAGGWCSQAPCSNHVTVWRPGQTTNLGGEPRAPPRAVSLVQVTFVFRLL